MVAETNLLDFFVAGQWIISLIDREPKTIYSTARKQMRKNLGLRCNTAKNLLSRSFQ